MNKAKFSRKAVIIEEVKSNLNMEDQPYIIEKEIIISEVDFNFLCSHLLSDYQFIKDNQSLMYIDEFNMIHCILVKSLASNFGFLINSQGYDYPRYCAIINFN